MEDSIFEALKNDLKEYGQRDTIKIYKEKVLDGKNRLKALEELSIEPKIEHLPDDTNIVAYVKSAGLHRRDLSVTQRVLISKQLEEWRVKHEQIEDKIKDIKKDPEQRVIYENAELKRIAKEANTNKPTVKKVIEIEKAVENKIIKEDEFIDLQKGKKTVEQVYKKTKPKKEKVKTPVEAYEETMEEQLASTKKELFERKMELKILTEIIEKMTIKLKELNIWNEFKHEVYPIYEGYREELYPSIKELREAMQ